MRMAGQKLAERDERSQFGGGAITGQSGGRRVAEQIHIGQANDEGGIAMPQDLQAGYLNLAIPGSPLGPMGLLSGHRLRDSQQTQGAILASQNYRA